MCVRRCSEPFTHHCMLYQISRCVLLKHHGFLKIILREDTDISETNGNSYSWSLFIVFLSCKDSLEIYFCASIIFVF